MAEIVELGSAAPEASRIDQPSLLRLIDAFGDDRVMAEAIDLAVAGLAAEANCDGLADSVRMLLSKHVDSLNEHIKDLQSLRKAKRGRA